MSNIDIDPRRIEEIAKALDGQVKQFRSTTAGRELSNAERRTLETLESELDATRELAEQAHRAEQDELRRVVKNGRVISTGGTHTGEETRQSTDDFKRYLRTGEVRASLVAGTDGNGGYLVPEPLHAPIVEKIREMDPILDLAYRFDLTNGSDQLMLPYKATHGGVANATETGARSEQDAPTLGNEVLACYDYYTDQRASQLWVDSVPDSEDLLNRWIAEDIYEQFGVDLAVGDGSGKASGLFAATSYYTVKLSGAANTLANTAFMSVFTGLPARYRPSAVWLMNSATLAVVSGYVLPNTQTPLVDWSTGEPRIYGRPVRECSSAPDIGDGAYPVAFGDIKQGYAVGVHREVSILRDPYTATPKIRYYGLGRLGGVPWDPQAIVLLKSDDA